jgi:molybdopterin-guanine dinucleotide biosynthesis protein A
MMRTPFSLSGCGIIRVVVEGSERATYPLSAVVLAGGGSRRMGTDKAFLKMPGGGTVLETILSKLARLSEEIILVTNRTQRYERLGVKVVADIYPGKGSLGGIYTGLCAMSHSHGLVVACDMPFLKLPLLRYMLVMAREYDVVVPRAVPWGGLRGLKEGGETAKERLLHPLHAVYAKSCLEPMKDLLESGDLRVIGFYPRVRVRYVEEGEIDIFDPEHLSFFNINTPADLRRAKGLL